MKFEGTVVDVHTRIAEVTEKVGQNLQNGQKLSELVVALATYNATLGNFIAGFEEEENLLEANLKLTREQIIKEVVEGKRGEKKTEAYAKALARIDTEELEGNYIKAKYHTRLLNIQRTDTNNLVTAVQSRLRYLTQQA